MMAENNTKPKISILLSYYNGSRFLKTYLENVKQQSSFEYTELVAVTCLLSNEDREIFLEWSDENHDGKLKLIEQDKLETQSYCWNAGIKESSGDFCCIWNIDDLRTPNSLEKQLNALEKNTEFGAVHGYFVISNEYGNKFGKLIDHSCYSKEEYKKSMLLGPFFMFRKSLCEKIGHFDEQLKSGSDYDFAIRLARGSDIKMINQIDGYFLDEKQGLSTRGDDLQPIERTVVELRYNLLDKLEKHYIEKAKEYDIDNMINFGKKILVRNKVLV